MNNYKNMKLIKVSSGDYYFVEIAYSDDQGNLYCNHVVPCQFRKNDLAVFIEEKDSFSKRRNRRLVVSDLSSVCAIPIKIERRNIVLEAYVKKETIETLLELLEIKVGG